MSRALECCPCGKAWMVENTSGSWKPNRCPDCRKKLAYLVGPSVEQAAKAESKDRN